jgi:hypothetical protein
MLVKRSTALIVAALLLTTMSTVSGFMVSRGGYLAPLASPPLIGAMGGIIGSISIGSVCPLCRIPQTCAPAPLYYNQIEAVIIPAPSSDLPLTVPVNWVGVGGCVVHGTFKVSLNPGAYSLTIGSCYLTRAAATFLNDTTCSGLPKTVLVESGTWTQVDISITTGTY